MSSCAYEQTEENANMLFVMSAMRNVQKHRRDHVGVSSGKMNWSSLVTMSYAICRYVLTCGGVPRIIWEDHSGLIVLRVVLSVRGCLMWGISEWDCFVWRKFLASYSRSADSIGAASCWQYWSCINNIEVCNGGLTGISVVRVNPKNHLMLLCK